MKYKKTVFKNGLRLITVPVKGTETVTIIAMVNAGSRRETRKEAGLSHFIEHMFFKGTQKRPTTLDISEELDAIGGEFNAFTGKERTIYYAKVDARHFGTALDVISDIFLNSKIEEKEIEKEKGTIIQELNMYEDTPVRTVSDVLEKLLYPDNSLGREIIGTKETLNAFQRKDFFRYLEKLYTANNTLVCVAGKFKEQEIQKKIETYFSQLKKKKLPAVSKVIEKQKKPALKIKFKKTDQTHFILSVRTYPEKHKSYYALSLLSIILGGNMSSRLFIEVREKLGLAYYIRTETETYRDCGYLATQAGVEHKNLELAVQTILKEYKKIASTKVTEKELRRAKDFIKGKSIMGLESSDEVALFFASQEIRKEKIKTPKEIFRKIDKVTSGEILKVAKDIFSEKKLNLAIIGPHKNSKKILKGLKF